MVIDKRIEKLSSARIAIIYYDAGLGHLREALAVRDILKPYAKHVELVNSTEIYKKSYSSFGKIYEFGQRKGIVNFFALSWWKSPPTFLLCFIHKLVRQSEKKLSQDLENYLKKRDIDFVIATHFTAAGALSASSYYKKRSINIMVDNMWKNTAWVYAVPSMPTIVPTEESLKNVFNGGAYGLDKNDLMLAGHPIPPELFNKIDTQLKRMQSKYYSNLPLRVIVTTGGAGTNLEDMKEIMIGGAELIKSKKISVVFWCNHYPLKLAKKLKENASKLGLKEGEHFKILSVGENKRINAVMGLHKDILESDLLVTKPGELALYGGIIPMYFFKPTGPQEYSLADFAFKHHYAKEIGKNGLYNYNLLEYASKNKKELNSLMLNGFNDSPLIAMQKNNMLLNAIISVFSKKD